MSQRLDTTKWLCYLLALHSGLIWTQVKSVTVRTPHSNPGTVQAQAKFFQYRHLPSSEDFDQGHRLGSERHFTERHERSRPSEGLFSAKVRWGDKKGGYGEHYWDLNHAGHTGNHGNDDGYTDDGSYHEHNTNDPYEEPSEHNPAYDTDEYDSEKSAKYDDSGRAKRAHPRLKPERRTLKNDEDHKPNNKKEIIQTAATRNGEFSEEDDDDDDDNDSHNQKKTKPKRQQYRKQEDKEHYKPEKERKQFVLVVSKKDDAEKEATEFLPQKQPDLTRYVPYEGGAGVRQHQQPEVSAANAIPRLFLEPSTGHVVDSATGQAYVLQPINVKNYN